MSKLSTLQTTMALCAMAVLPLAHATNITKEEYKAGKDRIEATYKADKDACKALSGNAKDVCQKEAEAKEKTAKAELEYSYSGKPADQNKIAVVKADAFYEVAKEKCDDLAGNAKDVCVKEAKATHTKEKSEAKMADKVSDARHDAAKDTNNAAYKAAAEKCDALSGDAKSQCVASTKAQFGK